jgi:1-acyl-sn-glycerol-3-phosphate acyltransferase
MIRTVFTAITVLVATMVCGSLAIIFGIFNPYSRVIYFLAQTWARLILIVAGAKIEVHGIENISANNNYIFISNHQSHFDVLGVYKVLPMTVRFLAKKELFRIPVFGWALSSVGMIKIDRSNHEKSLKSIEFAQQIIKNKGVSLVIFPEGTRSFDGQIHKFKKGAFVIAIKGNIPIIPVSISGSRFILKKHTLRIEPGIIKIVFDKPIEIKDYSYDQRENLVTITRDIIQRNIDPNINEREEH